MYQILVWLSALVMSCSALGAAMKPCEFKDAGAKPVYTLSANTQRVKDILTANCIGCHDVGSKNAKKRFDNILDAAQLRAVPGMVSDTDPAGAVLWQRLTLEPKRMPLGEDKLSDDDLAAVKQWMVEKSPDFVDGQPAVPARITYEQEVACISSDVSSLNYYDAKYMRYVSLAEIYNLGQTDRFQKASSAVDKLVNSISFNPHLTPTKAIDSLGVIRRIDLRDYDMKYEDWDSTILGAYPYGIAFFDSREFDGYEVNIAQKTGSPRAWVRADWFVQQVSQPPLYYDLLHLPKTLQELEALLRVDQYSTYYDQALSRGILRRSGVAHYNRVADLRDLRYWVQGVKVDSIYAITYDVADMADKLKNFLAFPFGPRTLSKLYVGKDAAWCEENKLFKHDAGEVIFGLPNGLQAFYLSDKDGKRQDEVPIDIADDRKNRAPHLGKVPYSIVNGVSCMSCHGAGLNQFTDVGRDVILMTAGFSKKQVDDYLYISPKQDVLDKKISDYNSVFARALKVVVKDPMASDPGHEPVFHTAKSYADYVTVPQLAAEIKMTVADFKQCLLHSPDLTRVLALADYDRGIVSRDVVESHFGTILKECNVGKQLVFKNTYVPPVAKCKVSLTNRTRYLVDFHVSYDGASENLRWGPGVTRTWETNSTGTLNYGRNAWSLVSCKNHSFQVRGRYVSIYQE